MINAFNFSQQEIDNSLSLLEDYEGFDKARLKKLGSKFDHVATILRQADQELKLNLSAKQHWQLLKYLDTLLLWSKTYNLTAITAPVEAAIKHLVDCLAILPCLNDETLKLSATDLLDIGTGAGLPSVIVAICQPERHCTPLDSNQKKIRFIRQVVSDLKLDNVTPIASRIQQHDGEYKLITSRAFSSLEDFIQLANPYLAKTGQLVAMKGKVPTEEIETLKKDWQIKVIELQVPFLSESRHIIHLKRL